MESKNVVKSSEESDYYNQLASLIQDLLPEINGTFCNIKNVSPKLNEILKLNLQVNDLDQLLILTKALKKLPLNKAEVFYDFFVRLLKQYGNNWEILWGMLKSKDSKLLEKTFTYIIKSCKEGSLTISEEVLDKFAEEVLSDNSRFSETENLKYFNKILNYYKPAEKSFNKNPLLYIFTKHQSLKIRRLAAKVLDSDFQPASLKIAEQLLGPKRFSHMADYIIYSCASYTDLLYLMPQVDSPSLAFDAIKNAEKICDKELIKELISQLGWDKINYGIKITKLKETTFNRSLPIYVSESEAQLLENISEVKKGSEVLMIRAFAGPIEDNTIESKNESPVARFRDYNLTHSKVLKDILGVSALTKVKIEKIISLLDKIVEDYVFLFSSVSDECKQLPKVYKQLKEKVYSEIKNVGDQPQLSTDLTRLVQMFEEPANVTECTTLHGLKRYLHQKGLKLGFKIVDKSQTTNRSVDLVLCVDNKISSILTKIHYADFESSNQDSREKQSVPFPIKVVTRGFLSQMLYGTENFPKVNIFCYGNEIHYYVWFRNHPVFIRIDFSPPLQGGMIDLEYYGVSNYELGHHPNLELDAIRKVYEKLDFDVKLEGTRIHARFDKERTVDFGLLCDKAEYLFRLVPYMMDLDWIIGALDYNEEAKAKIIKAWAESFILWGALPVKNLINETQNKILCYSLDQDSSQIRTEWNGKDKYRDIYSTKPEEVFIKNIRSVFTELGIDLPKIEEQNKLRPFGQIYLERRFLWTFREAIKSGKIAQNEKYFYNTPFELFRRTDVVEMFAKIISGKEGDLSETVKLAKYVLPMERTLNFQTIGYIGDFNVQMTKIPLLGNNINLFVVRDKKDMLMLALYSKGNGIYKHRKFISDKWEYNWGYSISLITKILIKNNYVIPFTEPNNKEIENTIEYIKSSIYSNFGHVRSIRLPGEKVINGITASPGRVIRKAILGINERIPEDFNDAILVAESISPTDNTFLYNASGVVSTGGGILSHAGLIAIQFAKPSIVIEGKWIKNKGGDKSVLYTQLEYRQEHKNVFGLQITIRKDLQEKQYKLNDGDVVILNADKGTLQVLGQKMETLALYDGFIAYKKMSKKISSQTSDFDLLSIRGKLLKARHQIERVLQKLDDAILTKYAISEILLGDSFSSSNTDFTEKTNLLKIILDNNKTASIAKETLKSILQELYHNYLGLYSSTVKNIKTSNYLYEIVVSRLEVINLHNLISRISYLVKSSGIEDIPIILNSLEKLNKEAKQRLEILFNLRKRASDFLLSSNRNILKARHICRQLDRLSKLIKRSDNNLNYIDELKQKIKHHELKKKQDFANRYILNSNDGGLELLPLVGGKAANLAEITQISNNNYISSWFALTNKAFQDVLNHSLSSKKSFIKEIPTAAKTIRDAIELILERNDINDHQKSRYITKLWESISIPDKILEEVKNEHEKIISMDDKDSDKQYFAIRSSSLEEDAEIAARAGEFETFLFVSGFENIIKFLKKTWSGLWTERAIHNRKVLGSNYQYTGGVIIQKIIWSRVSGVMQTINISKSEVREIVINAGLGLGEGIVSGVVASDQITISKEGNLEEDPIKFKYTTADKRTQIIFDEETGAGTKLAPTLYHQRFRPALEYVELCELAKIATRLEAEYGYPLDIEFAIEGSNIWVMQVRPVATFLSALNETIEKHPILI